MEKVAPVKIKLTGCRNCGAKGHVILACPIVRCFKCQRSGHMAVVCEVLPCESCGNYGHDTEECPRCEKCSEYGHSADTCRSKKKSLVERMRSQKPRSQPSKEGKKEVVCERCSRRGHETEECYTKLWCGYCQSKDHHPDTCPQKAKHKCKHCGENHLGHQCRNEKIRRPQGRDDHHVVCNVCSGPHAEDDCPEVEFS